MAEETEQSVTSVLMKSPADALSANDILYLIQGTGSNRDRKVTLTVNGTWAVRETTKQERDTQIFKLAA